ncbi:hypothetical protein ES708_18450 [subsurface metagenome]
MASFNFNLQQRYTKGSVDINGNKPLNPKKTRLYLFVIHDRENIAKLKTEYLILPRQWDFTKKRVIHQVSGATVINRRLNTLIESVEKEYHKLRTDYPGMKWPELTDNLKGFIKNRISPVYDGKHKSFFKVFNKFTEAKSHDVSELTVNKYNTLKLSIRDFKPDVEFEKIDLQFYRDYIQYLRKRKPIGRQKAREEGLQTGLLNDTIAKYIESLKTFLKWSFENEYHTNDIFKNSEFKVNQKSKKQLQEGKNDIVTLRIDEVFHLYNFDFSDNKRLERVRDLFCFMTFTLQRWSDAIRFEEKQINVALFEGEKIKEWNFRSYKTGKEITVPFVGDFMGKAYEILEKYDFNLPLISEQRFNSYIKEACKIAGLDREKAFKRYVGQKEIITSKSLHEYISSHAGRRTGISLLLNVYQMPIHFVRDLSGHSDLKTLDGYIEKDSQALIGSLMKNTNGHGISPLKIAK